MPNKVFKDSDARARVLDGAQEIYDAVRVTLGPLGRNVVIENQFGLPVPTHDGVTVARSIDLEVKDDDELGKKIGADMMKLAAGKVNDVVGDGTTTVTVLAYHLLNEGNKLIAAGHNPMQIKRQLDAAAEKLMRRLPGFVEKISGDKEKIRQVALLSAGGDKEIGDMLAEVMGKLGENSNVTVEMSQGIALTHEIVEGFKWDRGYVSPYMMTDVQYHRAIVEKPLILVTDATISNIQDLIPLFETLASQQIKQLVIVCADMDGDALQTLILNKMKGNFLTVVVKAPAFGDRRKEMLEDIATVTGAKVVSREQGMQLIDTSLDMLGRARRFVADPDTSTIVEGAGEKRDIQERVASITHLAQTADSEFNKEKFEERAAALAGKVAVIKVGGKSETEIEERKYRVDDAVFATKAAITDGTVPGGGVTYLNIVDDYRASDDFTDEPGERVLLNGLEQPFLQLMLNSGHDASYMRAKVRESKKHGYGFSVFEPDKLVELRKAGIIEPAKVARECIQSAVSIAGTALTMGAMIATVPKEQLPQAPGPVAPR